MHPDLVLMPSITVDVSHLEPQNVVMALLDMRRFDALSHEPDIPWDEARLERALNCWYRSGLGGGLARSPGYPPAFLRDVRAPVVFSADGRTIEAGEYDYTHGEGAAQEAVSYLRRTGLTNTRALRLARDTTRADHISGPRIGTGFDPFALGVPVSLASGGALLLVQLEILQSMPIIALPLAVGVVMSLAGFALGTFD